MAEVIINRIYIEKRQPHNVEALAIVNDLKQALGLDSLTGVRVLNRYDAEGIEKAVFDSLVMKVFGEPQLDNSYSELPKTSGKLLAVEYLPGQYDQRADSAAQCIGLCTGGERPLIRTARVYVLEGSLTEDDLQGIRNYLINPVECREASLELPKTLADSFSPPLDVAILNGFCDLDEQGLISMVEEYSLAMDLDDLRFCRDYFKGEHRDPTLTELKVIDTYWSDHCRHTTFSTSLEEVTIEPAHVRDSYNRYLELRAKLNRTDRPITLMDLATIGARELKKEGLLPALDLSEEINACSVKITVDVNGVDEAWLLMFKNETHNHPTEIEPFGGAATCLGGAIRDPLSGRAFVYQAMRVTGAGNPLTPVAQTLQGKLPQRKIVTQATAGYSSYGNQIGLATGLVHEIYHEGYTAKRMEVGAVIAAVKAENVVREIPATGDVILLLGGGTGRDGCGGATGSSKAHTTDSLNLCGAEVQKGNAPEERKIQRLFRNPAASRLIKRCNDFGAGGVSVAVGELADSLDIDLDAVPKKYEGLDGTELAISESQERMAVVLAPNDVAAFIALAAEENLHATQIAVVTDSGELRMLWRGKLIANLKREFLNTNGAPKRANATVGKATDYINEESTLPFGKRMIELAGNLNVCSQKGMGERFDCSVGAATVLSPFGGKYQETPIQAMAAKIPVKGETDTASLMAYGFMPRLSESDPYAGAVAAVYESVAKVIAAGGSRKQCWLSFQEYFQKLGNDATKWGKPLSALLGALDAQLALECGAIGGKDSMSGSFNELSVPPTLISFAVSATKASAIISPEFKSAGNLIAGIAPPYDENNIPDLASMRQVLDIVAAEIASGNIKAAWVCGEYGVAEGLLKMSLGNRIGVRLNGALTQKDIFKTYPGVILMECVNRFDGAVVIGQTVEEFIIEQSGEVCDLDAAVKAYRETLEPIFPCSLPTPKLVVPTHSFYTHTPKSTLPRIASPKVVVLTFPGTNSEYDTCAAFEKAGAKGEIFVVKNRSAADVEQSVAAFEAEIRRSQIVAIPGGFSGGDEPEGSGKFIVAFFRNPRIQEAVRDLLFHRDGLMIGICNGFQALIKLGLVPFGDIVEPTESSPTISFNRIGRHQSKLCYTRISSVASPWMMYHTVGELHTLPVSHGEGRFIASPEVLATLAKNGQIAAQYVNLSGATTMDTEFNPNFSADAVEALLSPDGRVLAKMGHSERSGANVFKNIPGEKHQRIFEGAVDYFAK